MKVSDRGKKTQSKTSERKYEEGATSASPSNSQIFHILKGASKHSHHSGIDIHE